MNNYDENKMKKIMDSTRERNHKIIYQALGMTFEELSKLDVDEQQKIIEDYRKKKFSKKDKKDKVTVMIGNGDSATFIKVKKGKRVLIGSGIDSTFIEAGLSLEEERERIANKIDSIVDGKIKHKTKSLTKKITGKKGKNK